MRCLTTRVEDARDLHCPFPRGAQIDELADAVVTRPLDDIDLTAFDELQSGDILFFDGSRRHTSARTRHYESEQYLLGAMLLGGCTTFDVTLANTFVEKTANSAAPWTVRKISSARDWDGPDAVRRSVLAFGHAAVNHLPVNLAARFS